jgi:serine phosphatase RsbU (regulator of sigma subunit)
MRIKLDIGCANVPRRDEVVSGDLTFVKTQQDKVLIVSMDVLGHGEMANQSAALAEDFLSRGCSFHPTQVLAQLHCLLAKHRGAAVVVCSVDKSSGQMQYVGVGNICVRGIFGQQYSLVPKDGVVGEKMHSVRVREVKLSGGDIVLWHSDGITSRFGYDDYPHIISDSAAGSAAYIVRQFSKGYDDASCIVMKVSEVEGEK